VRRTTDKLQRTLDLLVVNSLAIHGPLHGYGISVHIQRRAKRVDQWEDFGEQHSVTASGRKQLGIEQARWTKLTATVNRVIGFA
jgi:hypothetical protein